MEGQLLVTPDMLINTSSEFSGISSQVQGITDNMMTKVQSLSSQWQGEASTAYLNKFQQLSDDITKMNGMIKEHVKDLNEMAENYMKAENENIQTAQALAGDVIS